MVRVKERKEDTNPSAALAFQAGLLGQNHLKGLRYEVASANPRGYTGTDEVKRHADFTRSPLWQTFDQDLFHEVLLSEQLSAARGPGLLLVQIATLTYASADGSLEASFFSCRTFPLTAYGSEDTQRISKKLIKVDIKKLDMWSYCPNLITG
ncbi:hypothetical protein Anapl_13702 [Anas platyrhynchos]|uniref:Uncharacterized protein n=1 Tax=Anas platyrhynchos TaxID=8839 RepID=R0LG84_ANAPL|nr:hypothetical protein Anapl_13702 [Anas platyrhynchos]